MIMSASATLPPATLGDDDLSRRLDELERHMSRLHSALTQKNSEIEQLRAENLRLRSRLEFSSLKKPEPSSEAKPWQQRPASPAGVLTQEEFELALQMGRDPVRVRHFKRAS